MGLSTVSHDDIEETTQKYTDRVLKFIAEIRGIDPSQNLPDEYIAIRDRTGIEFGLPQLIAALQVGVKFLMEEQLERLNAYTGVNETNSSTKPKVYLSGKMCGTWRL